MKLDSLPAHTCSIVKQQTAAEFMSCVSTSTTLPSENVGTHGTSLLDTASKLVSEAAIVRPLEPVAGRPCMPRESDFGIPARSALKLFDADGPATAFQRLRNRIRVQLNLAVSLCLKRCPGRCSDLSDHDRQEPARKWKMYALIEHCHR